MGSSTRRWCSNADVLKDGLRNIIGNLNICIDALSEPDRIFAPPLYRAKPINEHDRGINYLIQAFPILFPSGQGRAREIEVKDAEYFRPLMRY